MPKSTFPLFQKSQLQFAHLFTLEISLESHNFSLSTHSTFINTVDLMISLSCLASTDSPSTCLSSYISPHRPSRAHLYRTAPVYSYMYKFPHQFSGGQRQRIGVSSEQLLPTRSRLLPMNPFPRWICLWFRLRF